MKFPSNILGIFSKHGGKISAEDSLVNVSPVILPVLELPSVQNLMGDGAGFPQQNSSFMLSTTQLVTNAGGAQDVAVVSLAPGLWDLTFNVHVASDDVGNFQISSIYLKDLTTTLVCRIHEWYSGVSVSVLTSLRMRVPIISPGGWEVRNQVANTAAAKTSVSSFALIANRMG